MRQFALYNAPRGLPLVVRLVLLVLGVMSTSGGAPVTLLSNHCSRHEVNAAAHAGSSLRAHPTPSSTSDVRTLSGEVANGTTHQCSHCPAEQCATTLPCSANSLQLVVSAETVMAYSPEYAVGHREPRRSTPSAPQQ